MLFALIVLLSFMVCLICLVGLFCLLLCDLWLSSGLLAVGFGWWRVSLVLFRLVFVG